MQSIFHFAFNVTDLTKARDFYGNIMQCQEGRSTESWVDFDFYGHQISLHLGTPFKTENTGKVGEHLVPMPHFRDPFGNPIEIKSFDSHRQVFDQ